TRSAKFVGGGSRTVQIDFRLRLEKVRVEPADFDAYRAFHREVSDTYRAWLTLEAVDDLRHTPGLEGLVLVGPGDSASAAGVARIYRHHGRRDDARRVLRRARKHRPDDLALWELSVKAAADRAEAEKVQTDLVRHFPDDPVQAIRLAAMLIDRDK